jgi:hypothetical protein
MEEVLSVKLIRAILPTYPNNLSIFIPLYQLICRLGRNSEHRLIAQTNASDRAKLDTSRAFGPVTAKIALLCFPQIFVFAFYYVDTGRIKSACFYAKPATDAILLNYINDAALVNTHGFILAGACVITGMVRTMLACMNRMDH